MKFVIAFFRLFFGNTLAFGLTLAYTTVLLPGFETSQSYADLVRVGEMGVLCIATTFITYVTLPDNNIPIISKPIDIVYIKFMAFFLLLDTFVIVLSRVSTPGLAVVDSFLALTVLGGMVLSLPKKFRDYSSFLTSREGVGWKTSSSSTALLHIFFSAVIIVSLAVIFVINYHKVFHLVNLSANEVPAGEGYAQTLTKKLFLTGVFAVILPIVSHWVVNTSIYALDWSHDNAMINTLVYGLFAGMLAVVIIQSIPFTQESDLYWKVIFLFLAVTKPFVDLLMRSSGLITDTV